MRYYRFDDANMRCDGNITRLENTYLRLFSFVVV